MSTVHSRMIRGNLAYWDTHRKRLISAVGPDVIQWEMGPGQFQAGGGTGTNPTGMTTTVVEVGTGTSEITASNSAGYVAEMVTAANDNDGIQVQLHGEAFELTSDQDLYFGIELEADEATQSDFLVGLCISDTDLLGGMTDGAYFECLDGGTGISFVVEKDSTETQTDSLGTFADATLVFLEFYWDGSGIEAFINGSSVATPSTNIPDNEALALSVSFFTGEASAHTAKIRQCRVVQIGR